MQNAETVLSIIRERGKQGLPLERIYRLLFNRDLYLRAYARLYSNDGAMTPGTTTETVDGMSIAKIDQLIDDIRSERYRWTPVRRTYIAKKHSAKKRPLGLPTWRDKLLQEAIRLILEAYFEPQFSDHSHGFRPQRGCHTALHHIQTTWTGTRWFIEGDIAAYYDSIDHDLLLSILGEKLHDNRFLRLIRELLQAGYLEDWKFHQTYSGVPQGGVVSPILANIYLDRFDKYVEQVLIPAHTRGAKRKPNPAYVALESTMRRRRRQGRRAEATQVRKQLQRLPSRDQTDPDYRRLWYIRYADDILLGFIGPRHEAEEIKRDIGAFLQTSLKLELSEQKTLITHATSQAARFLGYEIVNQQSDTKHTRRRRSANGRIALRVPRDVVLSNCARYRRNGKVVHLPERVKDSDFTIVVQYQQEYRGLVHYYLMAHNVSHLSLLHWVTRTSLLKTLAYKHKTSLQAIYRRYRNTAKTVTGEILRCLEVRVERGTQPPLIARFGGISLRRQHTVLEDRLPRPLNHRSELITRLLADACELCGSREHIEVHHIRKLADLQRPGRRERPRWVKRMAAMHRKTLVVCRSCHDNIHAGRPTRQQVPNEPLESWVL
jgi:group II intron reverse transcriptase/maturase